MLYSLSIGNIVGMKNARKKLVLYLQETSPKRMVAMLCCAFLPLFWAQKQRILSLVQGDNACEVF